MYHRIIHNIDNNTSVLNCIGEYGLLLSILECRYRGKIKYLIV